MRQLISFALLTLLGAELLAVENPNVRSRVGSSTTVPSSTRSGLVPNRSYNAASGNDVVTGNVGGMKYFHGVVPYGSSYYSGSGSTSSVDAFLRRSDNPIVSDRSPGQYRSYYEPRRTAASAVRADGSGLSAPIITNQGQNDPYTPPMLPQTLNTPYSRQRPLSVSSSELERVLSKQMLLHEEMKRNRTDQDTQDATRKEPKTESIFFQEYLRKEELKSLEKPTEQEIDKEKPKLKPEEEVLEAVRKENAVNLLDDSPLKTSEKEQAKANQPATAAGGAAQPTEELTGEKTLEQAQAAALLSRYKTFERLAAARVSEYLAAAETFLKEGSFYKAADTFALATVWDPSDARPLAGQAFSLFAAGEYMSSAYYLGQAMMRDPNVASGKVDLAALIGNRDVFENRLIEIKTWQERSGSGELAFLMAFILHHDGKTEPAAEAIGIAAEKMPDDKAVAILKKTILPDAAAH